ncbi:hypothetical protein [Amycolatopsis sp. NPDC052450]|uniref:hypothetical protein n=1 Tax=Amycolatopsis sp. NPDC052450 TaxID=3363937 RepID=UPI0037C65CAC
MHRINQKITVGRDNSGDITQTGVAGDTAETTKGLLELVGRLQAEVRGQNLPEQEVLDDVLDDLATDLGRDDGEPAVMRRYWEKAKSLLSGVSQFTELVADISDGVEKVVN